MAQTIRLKRGKNANVNSLTLAAGEPAFVLDTGKLIVGNGTDKVFINPDIGTPGTYTKVTIDAQGRVTVGTSLSASDIPNLTLSQITDVGTAASKNIGAGSGNVPVIGSDGKLSANIMPAIAISDTFVVKSQTEMLALTAQVGDIAVRTDLSKCYILTTNDPTKVECWQELLTPASPVQSVAGKTGTVTLSASDVGLGNVTNESKSTMLASPALTGTPTAPTASTSANNTQVATTAFVKSQGYVTSSGVTSVAAGKGLSGGGSSSSVALNINCGDSMSVESGALDVKIDNSSIVPMANAAGATGSLCVGTVDGGTF
ncbi:hypothetical protein [Clostridium sp. AWRP]|uniref:hyaluronate lyase N-terminal domain-containing protein n=1 Tax=Clostridium sp. AWRP TaxID=2212991 RepID=UPI000FD8F62E|nr:hypothetical protein [Clostridium sp. AWRP]AZV58823.1 hypothetical protein DMR38_20805 [Clostridium sp. AWRP]